MGEAYRIGAGSGFWGDIVDPAIELIEHGDLSAICFDLLAELTVAILHRSRQRDPAQGYIPDLEPILAQALRPAADRRVKVITNGGGANPRAAARLAARVACDQGLEGTRIATIAGDDLTDRLDEIRGSGWALTNLDTGEEDVDSIADRIVAITAYTGSDKVIEALDLEADVVIGGRLADSALYCGPIAHHFGWQLDGDEDLVAAALTVGHILECAGIGSGGMSSQWRLSQDPWRIGFPLAEVQPDGSAVITKVAGSGGIINEWTTKEHLLYEVHDPTRYLLPDGVVDLSEVRVDEIGKHRVRVSGARGRQRPETLKVQIGYEDGWIAEGRAVLPWPDALEKADWCEELVRRRLAYLGVEPVEWRFDRVGIDSLAGESAPRPTEEPNEVELRCAVRTRTRSEAEVARRAILTTATIGPVGTAFGVPQPVRKVVALWPTLVPRALVDETLVVRTAAEELAHAGA